MKIKKTETENSVLLKESNGYLVASINEERWISPGEVVSLDLGISPHENEKLFVSPSEYLSENKIMILNAGVFDGNIVVRIMNCAPSVVSLQSEDRGYAPDLSVWNDADIFTLKPGDDICYIHGIQTTNIEL